MNQKRMGLFLRFWYENPWVFKPEQLIQIKQTSLGRVLCDNGDDLRRVTPDVFKKPDKEGDLVDCAEVKGVGLHPWFGTLTNATSCGILNGHEVFVFRMPRI